MGKEPYFSNWKKIFIISYGLVYIFFNLWVIFHIPEFVAYENQDVWFKIFISYGLLNALIFSNADMRNKLFNIKLTDFIPRFIIFLIPSLIFFSIILTRIENVVVSPFDLISQVPLWLGLTHALTFATTESVIWQGYLDHKIGHPWSEMTAGIFHLYIWTGTPLIVFISATLLFAMFSIFHWRFSKSRKDLAPVIAFHTAFNIIKLGLLITLGGII